GDDLLLGDQPQCLVLANLRVALVIRTDQLDLRSAEIGQAGGRRERKLRQLGVRIVDDFGSELDRILGGSAGARGVARERIDHADPHVVGAMGGHRRQQSEQQWRQQTHWIHVFLPDWAAYRAALVRSISSRRMLVMSLLVPRMRAIASASGSTMTAI